LYLTLDSPQSRNALTDELLDELIAAFERAADDAEVQAVVLTSSHERVFSAGGDLQAFAGDAATITKYDSLSRFPRIFSLIGALGKPVICAANGDVLAGAFGLALACDLMIAEAGVRFGCPEINVGVFPFMISALIYRNVNRMKANELMMLGELIDADEAWRLNIVNKVVLAETFAEVVDGWAHRLAAKSPLLMRWARTPSTSHETWASPRRSMPCGRSSLSHSRPTTWSRESPPSEPGANRVGRCHEHHLYIEWSDQ
jgi:enoyl-CoA hydratase/carnithine racemase